MDLDLRMESHISQQVSEKTKPLNEAFKVILQQDINRIKWQIAQMEYRKSHDDSWSSEDARQLADLEIELKTLEQAKEELK